MVTSMVKEAHVRVKASEFKARCLKLMDEVARTGRRIVITKNGRPVAELGPVVSRRPSLAGAHAGAVRIRGDIIGPLEEDWEAGG
jgi:prevent-host-death family protein